MHAKGTDKRGQGGAQRVDRHRRCARRAARRVVDVVTDFTITGRLARFGRGGMIEDISKRMMRDFSQCLQATLAVRAGSRRRPRSAAAADAVPPGEEAEAAVASAGGAAAEASAAQAPPPRRRRRRRRPSRSRRRPSPCTASGSCSRCCGSGSCASSRASSAAARSERGPLLERRRRTTGSPAPMEAMGREVLERLPLSGGETVIDAGCGSGRVTEALLERLPERARDRRRRLGLDDRRRARAPGRPRRAARGRPRRASTSASQADAILSTATFHWIADHDALFARLRAHLRAGGRLVAQCGGQGNIASVHAAAREVMAGEPYAPQLRGLAGPVELRRAATRPRSACAPPASREARAWLQERPVTPDDAARLPDRDQPRRAPRAPARGAAPALRRRGHRAPRRPAGDDRLRAPEHRRGGVGRRSASARSASAAASG